MIGKRILTALVAWIFGCLLWAHASPSLTLLAESEFPPYSYKVSDQEIDGIAIRVVRELMQRANMAPSIELQPWIRAYKTALDKPNIGIFPVKRTYSRNDQLYWIGVIAPYPMSVYAIDPTLKNRVTHLWPQTKLRVGAVHQAYVENVLVHMGFRKGINLFSVTDYPQNVKKLMSNRIDLLPISDYSMAYILQQSLQQDPSLPQPYRLMDFHPDRYPVLYLALSLDSDPALVKRLQLLLAKMHADGRYDAIVDDYLKEHHLSKITN
ncbi:substrate-binding periplasmic protein [Celerinatantimonas sp. YJH-8]|uniref:substrate-binding periplasmic protein n=1 Tax=Celerinatantimonas sp. YJH-8 TaxID=3228714 RepID=UPI0038BED6EC